MDQEIVSQLQTLNDSALGIAFMLSMLTGLFFVSLCKGRWWF